MLANTRGRPVPHLEADVPDPTATANPETAREHKAYIERMNSRFMRLLRFMMIQKDRK